MDLIAKVRILEAQCKEVDRTTYREIRDAYRAGYLDLEEFAEELDAACDAARESYGQ